MFNELSWEFFEDAFWHSFGENVKKLNRNFCDNKYVVTLSQRAIDALMHTSNAKHVCSYLIICANDVVIVVWTITVKRWHILMCWMLSYMSLDVIKIHIYNHCRLARIDAFNSNRLHFELVASATLAAHKQHKLNSNAHSNMIRCNTIAFSFPAICQYLGRGKMFSFYHKFHANWRN